VKRRVLKAGRSSLAVSLPKDFVENNKILPGQEIDVTSHGATVIIKCEHPRSEKKYVDISSLNIHNKNRRIHDKILGSLFKQGGDTFIITCASKERP